MCSDAIPTTQAYNDFLVIIIRFPYQVIHQVFQIKSYQMLQGNLLYIHIDLDTQKEMIVIKLRRQNMHREIVLVY